MSDEPDLYVLHPEALATERRTGELMKSPFTFKKYGQSGMDISELWPHLSGALRGASLRGSGALAPARGTRRHLGLT